MIILDTNVLSGLMRREPDPLVVDWLDGQPAGLAWITSITLFETRFGLDLLPEGKRKGQLVEAFSTLISVDFRGRLLTFDSASALHAAQIAARRQLAGRPVEMRDTFIAGIALAHKADLATRNTRHFDDLPITLINPWC